jgi:hypothetical protein
MLVAKYLNILPMLEFRRRIIPVVLTKLTLRPTVEPGSNVIVDAPAAVTFPFTSLSGVQIGPCTYSHAVTVTPESNRQDAFAGTMTAL